MRKPSRRALLASAATIGLAGCLSFTVDENEEGGNGTPDPGGAETPRSTPTTTATDRNGDPTQTPGGSTPTLEPTQTPETTQTPVPVHEEYETTTVTARTPEGEGLGSVTAAIADTPQLRYLGLSDTEFLPEDRGMLFVFDSPGERTFVMREMDFGIDIVYADPEGVITTIHHAPEPGPDEDGNEQRYPGTGQYVLEVNYNWTTDRGVEAGDVLEFEL